MRAPSAHPRPARPALAALGALAAALLPGRAASADAAPPALVAAPVDRLVDVRAADLPAAPVIAAGVGHRGERFASLEVPLGGDAAVGVGLDDRLVVGDAGPGVPRAGLAAWFRVGAAPDRFFRGQPALELALLHGLGGEVGGAFGGGEARAIRFAELRAGASRRLTGPWLGALTLVGGVGAWDAEADGHPRLGVRARPYGGVGWAPPSYPRTVLLLEADAAPTVLGGVAALGWRIGWGLRYQALPRLSLDLVVRSRLDTELGGSTVMLRAELR